MGYETLEILKTSSKGTVSLVFDPERHCMLVEKRIEGKLEIYQKLQTLSHPYLPKLYDVRYEDGQTVILEEYIQGGSLGAIHATEKQLTGWLKELCEVLQFLHSHHILHRDIKPSNLLLGSDGHIRLIDFDAAREERSGAEQDTQLLGTRGYAPPEQFGFSQTDERSDIYALGVTFRELLGPLANKRRWKRILGRCTAMEPKLRYRHVRHIQVAVLLDRICRRILYPLLALFAAAVLLFSAFVFWSYTTDTDFRDAIGIVLSSRRELVFDTVDIAALEKTESVLDPFVGEVQTAYRGLTVLKPDLMFISTGYTDETGNLLFGGFTTTYEINTGETYYQEFVGLYAITGQGVLCHIPPEGCSVYAQAVLALYRLDTFDTPLF